MLDVDKDICGAWVNAYIGAQVLTIVTSFSVTIVNVILSITLKKLSDYERHHHASKLGEAIISKILSAQFFNTAIIVLIVNWEINIGNTIQ